MYYGQLAVFSTDGLLADASVPPMRKQVRRQSSYEVFLVF